MGRRRRGREPVWPLLIAVAVVGGGVGLSALLSGGPGDGTEAVVDDPAPETEASLPTPWDRVRVEVLNAGGVQGAAAEATDMLRADGFDVVYFGNASSFGSASTVVLDRTGEEEAARAVASTLGAPEVRSETDATRLVDVTVLVGADWPLRRGSGNMPEPATFEGVEAPAEPPPWWDLSRFFNGTR